MFVEISQKKWPELKKKLDELGIPYNLSDGSLPGEKATVLHVDISGAISQDQREAVSRQMESIFGKSVLERDRDGNGVPDYAESKEAVTVKYKAAEKEWKGPVRTFQENYFPTDAQMREQEEEQVVERV